MIKLMVAAGFLALNLYVYHSFATDESIPERQAFEGFPLEFGEWYCPENGQVSAAVIKNLGVTDYLLCSYVRGQPRSFVNAYVGYHQTQVRKEGGGAGENAIHPPEHCLPGSGWDVIDARIVTLDLPGLPTGRGRPEAKRFIIAKGQARQLVYFWYQSRGRVLARNHEVIFHRFLDRAVRNRTDGSLVRLTIPIIRTDEARAERDFREFAEYFVPLLTAYVPS